MAAAADAVNERAVARAAAAAPEALKASSETETKGLEPARPVRARQLLIFEPFVACC